ncbi:MAG: nucleoside triphosphate pyrophosphohydrolase [Treponema sp.]|jgi:tetrapyrrole methylase family protein/MazG family protein|nr:nucleoside triphosphate pyrophosphohydrolase [Treponema sp.]
MQAFKELYDIVAHLRGPGGCPWDQEQTPLTLRQDLLEETYECIEAISEGNKGHIKEELGDIFLIALMLSYMHEQEGSFTVDSVLEGITEKLIRRHPHVFNGLEVKDSAEVLDNWARIKVEQEGRRPKDSILDEVSAGLPPLDRAWKLQKKAAKAGFDWPDISGVWGKVEEELEEVRSAVLSKSGVKGGSPLGTPTDRSNAKGGSPLEEELGDLLFSVINLCRRMDVEPSVALQRTNAKFTRRFRYVEKSMKEKNIALQSKNLALMDQFWEEAKNLPEPAGAS